MTSFVGIWYINHQFSIELIVERLFRLLAHSLSYAVRTFALLFIQHSHQIQSQLRMTQEYVCDMQEIIIIKLVGWPKVVL